MPNSHHQRRNVHTNLHVDSIAAYFPLSDSFCLLCLFLPLLRPALQAYDSLVLGPGRLAVACIDVFKVSRQCPCARSIEDGAAPEVATPARLICRGIGEVRSLERRLARRKANCVACVCVADHRDLVAHVEYRCDALGRPVPLQSRRHKGVHGRLGIRECCSRPVALASLGRRGGCRSFVQSWG